jgi:hypothetical protein
MKKNYLVLILLTVFLLSACQSAIPESAMETAVSLVILTSSSEESIDDPEPQTDLGAVATSNAKIEEANAQLENANLLLTEQATKNEALQAELNQAYILLTPTITSTPQDTPTPTITPSPTLKPTFTEEVMPWYHSYVEAVGTIPIYEYEDENDAGFPIMQKTSPIVKISDGDEFIVNTTKVRADGGVNFYQIVGPKHKGYYVRIGDVKKIK